MSNEKTLGPTIKSVLLIASYAPSLINFRGPLIEELVARGYNVVVSAPNISNKVVKDVEALGATVHSVPLSRTGVNPIRDFTFLVALIKLIGKIKPDFVLTYTIKPNIWGTIAASRHGVPSAAMVTGLGFAFADTKAGTLKTRIINNVTKLLYRISTARNKYVIFQNPDDRDDFLSSGCLKDPLKSRLVDGSGVDIKHFAKVPLPEQPVFLMISRLLRNKGVKEYCEAANFVKDKFPNTRMLLVGYLDEGPDGIDKAELDIWTSGGIEYLGRSEDVRQQISSASVYVLPSYREGTPRSVLEAMSMGRPILTSNVPGCRETTTDGENGFLVPPRDVTALTEKMIWMIEHPEERKRMGKKSRQIVEKKYDVRIVNSILLKHLDLQ